MSIDRSIYRKKNILVSPDQIRSDEELAGCRFWRKGDGSGSW